ncbi:glutamate-5-semialdehyde dehydrogenase [Acidiphilium acidophilum]|uniref:Gamma-glutamyl phosphate reductase n=2 Tax=Acidiphilium acidophilum TaxID=76588 RepID=A0AAW9DPC9_ACIAO|nr:glutamate-5-semialdehyde dehydrogenase [Acidiphilium acidophilum]MDX5930756.1 glutamate-5-semialdehyde dehydrogenase [Acidiphilium acidophilum]
MLAEPIDSWLRNACREARDAGRQLAQAPARQRDAALVAVAGAIRRHREAIMMANAQDIAAYSGTDAFRDRLLLTEPRIEAMAAGVEIVAGLPDPLGGALAEWERPNGLVIRRVPQPIGVIGMIYESRPNVGADAAAICLKSGNAVILRGGSESQHSARAIHEAISEGLQEAGLPGSCVQIAPTTDREFVAAMLRATGMIDLIIPRGGKSLVERVQREARVAVLAHAEGLNHTYVDRGADLAMARTILANAKMRRTGVCGATETLLIDGAVAEAWLPVLVGDLRALGCDCRGDERARAIVAMGEAEFDTEWLDAVISVGVVDGLEGALAHIGRYGSSHTDAIVTEDAEVAGRFLAGIDSAVGMWNASTQFCDGGEFGFGAEIGIATGRVHARGPVGPAQLTTFRYHVVGTGQVRP